MIFALHLGLFLLALFNFGRAFFYLKDLSFIAIWFFLATIALIQCARAYRTKQR